MKLFIATVTGLLLYLTPQFTYACDQIFANKKSWETADQDYKLRALDEDAGHENLPPGFKQIEGSSVKKSGTDIKGKKNREFVKAMIRYAREHTEDPSPFDPSKDGFDSVHYKVITDKRGKILGGYIYLIYTFEESGHPDNLQDFWVQGYFDESIQFLGQGVNYQSHLVWYTY